MGHLPGAKEITRQNENQDDEPEGRRRFSARTVSSQGANSSPICARRSDFPTAAAASFTPSPRRTAPPSLATRDACLNAWNLCGNQIPDATVFDAMLSPQLHMLDGVEVHET